ncbi:MAG: arylamine N-acetyltransferase [Oscillospiraceae bacterium]|jgi:N-hydroxyarylamine O-acetyltransferase|nr:arylamine N-acetyltransferase [Oscillospiraceae bacterium]
MDLSAYFDRVGYTGDASPTLKTLVRLHTGHAYNIPFENLDVYAGKTISLAPDALFDKLVTRRRGGYCFEMNGLFTLVLREIGFEPRQLLARTAFLNTYSALLHEVIVVQAEDGYTYLCDVGYGNDGLSTPILRSLDGERAEFEDDKYRFTYDANYGYVLSRYKDGCFSPMYAFADNGCVPDDFEVANHYTSTHPQSFFRQQRFATKPTPSGRITLTENRLKIVDGGAVAEREVSGEKELAELFLKYFGLTL